MDLNEYIETLGLRCRATFIPHDLSRNADDPIQSLNWLVRIDSCNGKHICTDYTQGYAHAMPKGARSGGWEEREARQACQSGIYSGSDIPSPKLADVLMNLVLDAQCYDEAGSFQEFCDNLGYSSDSISGRDMYEACGKTSRELRAMLTSAQYSKLAAYSEDY